MADVASDVPQIYLEDMMMTYYATHVEVSQERAIQLEEMTRFQGIADDLTANIWLVERRKRVTSSTAGQIAKRRATTKVCSIVKTLLYRQFRGTAATEWGKEQESVTAMEYVQHMRQHHRTQRTIQPSGLVIHPVHSWLAASPDDLVSDPSCEDPFGLVEYKNPYTHRETQLQTAALTKDFCLKLNQSDGSLSLKPTHQYFYQVQIAMYCTQRNWCDFVVRTTVDIHVERIAVDREFLGYTVMKLKTFYFGALLPELALPRRMTGGIREPSEWLQDSERWTNRIESL